MNKQTDLTVGVDHDLDDDGSAARRRRRMVRWIAVLTVGILAVLAVWQDTLS